MVLVVHNCLIQKMIKVHLRLREIYLLTRWNPMESYSSLCIRTYDVILLGYTCVPGFHIGGHMIILEYYMVSHINTHLSSHLVHMINVELLLLTSQLVEYFSNITHQVIILKSIFYFFHVIYLDLMSLMLILVPYFSKSAHMVHLDLLYGVILEFILVT